MASSVALFLFHFASFAFSLIFHPMTKKSDEARVIYYKPFPHVTRSSLHPYIHPSTILRPSGQISVLNLISLLYRTLPVLEMAKLTVANQMIIALFNEKILVGGKKKQSSVARAEE